MSEKTTKAPELKPEIAEISTILQKGIKIDKLGAADIQPDMYVANLPEGLTEQIVESVSAYNTKFVAGASHALGTKATEAMAKHPGIEEVTGVFPFTGRDNVSVTTLRQTKSHPPGKPELETTRYGHTVPTLTIAAGNKNSASLKNVKATLYDKAAEVLSK